MINAAARPERASEPVKVLVAEDEALVRLVLAETLRDAGFRVFEAANADAALAVIYTVQVDVVVTDLQMTTAADGVVIARHVRERHPHAPVLLASVLAPPVDGCPFDASFIKPYEPEDIAAWIRRHCSVLSAGKEDLMP
jgi:CheY-like chemotaxis protein